MLDTSVLLSDPRALVRFHEHQVVVPVVVLMELEGKRQHPELGWAARTALRLLERFRVEHGSLTQPILANGEGGTVQVELNHQGTEGLPTTLSADNNDHRILAVAHNLAAEGRHVTLVTKDLPLRLKASIVGLAADEYRNEQVGDGAWTGFTELSVAQSDIDELFEERVVDLTPPACSRATPEWPWRAVRSPRSAGWLTTSACTWCAVIGPCSTCGVAVPSSGWRSTY